MKFKPELVVSKFFWGDVRFREKQLATSDFRIGCRSPVGKIKNKVITRVRFKDCFGKIYINYSSLLLGAIPLTMVIGRGSKIADGYY